MWMSGHPGNRRQWKAEMMTAATHLACVARSQSMGNGIPGLQKEKKENHENGSLLYVTYNQKEKEHEKTGFWNNKRRKRSIALHALQ